jgi:peptide chain release factor 1
VVELFRRHRALSEELAENRQLLHDEDPEIRAMAQEEVHRVKPSCRVLSMS